MKLEIDLRIELARRLYEFAQTIRRGKQRPDLAAVAAEREIQFKRELEELEQLAATQPLEHKEAA